MRARVLLVLKACLFAGILAAGALGGRWLLMKSPAAGQPATSTPAAPPGSPARGAGAPEAFPAAGRPAASAPSGRSPHTAGGWRENIVRSLAESDPELRKEALTRLTNSLPAADLPAAVDFLHGLGASPQGLDMELQVLRRWAELEPQRAADWAVQNAEGSARRELIEQVALAWADKDLFSAIKWARQLAGGEDKNEALKSVVGEAVRFKPGLAVELAVREQIPIDNLPEFLAYASAQWAATEPDDASEWAQQLPEGPTREQVLSRVAMSMADRDPVSAANLIVSVIKAGRPQDDAVVGVVQRWVQKDPAAAAKWVATGLPDNPLRLTAVENLVSIWADRDLDAARQWISTVAPGKFRDAAVAHYVIKAALVAPDDALLMVESIEDADLRARQLSAVRDLIRR